MLSSSTQYGMVSPVSEPQTTAQRIHETEYDFGTLMSIYTKKQSMDSKPKKECRNRSGNVRNRKYVFQRIDKEVQKI